PTGNATFVVVYRFHTTVRLKTHWFCLVLYFRCLPDLLTRDYWIFRRLYPLRILVFPGLDLVFLLGLLADLHLHLHLPLFHLHPRLLSRIASPAAFSHLNFPAVG